MFMFKRGRNIFVDETPESDFFSDLYTEIIALSGYF